MDVGRYRKTYERGGWKGGFKGFWQCRASRGKRAEVLQEVMEESRRERGKELRV